MTCHKCDTFTGENPLVKQGLVPESFLAKIMLLLPARKVSSRKRKMAIAERGR